MRFYAPSFMDMSLSRNQETQIRRNLLIGQFVSMQSWRSVFAVPVPLQIAVSFARGHLDSGLMKHDS